MKSSVEIESAKDFLKVLTLYSSCCFGFFKTVTLGWRIILILVLNGFISLCSIFTQAVLFRMKQRRCVIKLYFHTFCKSFDICSISLKFQLDWCYSVLFDVICDIYCLQNWSFWLLSKFNDNCFALIITITLIYKCFVNCRYVNFCIYGTVELVSNEKWSLSYLFPNWLLMMIHFKWPILLMPFYFASHVLIILQVARWIMTVIFSHVQILRL